MKTNHFKLKKLPIRIRESCEGLRRRLKPKIKKVKKRILKKACLHQ